MRRSLKIHIFIHVLIVASLIVFVNRNIAQWLLLDQIKGLLRTGLVTAFEKCEAEIDYAEDFYSCHRKINPGNILNSFAESYVLCPSPAVSVLSLRPQECDVGSKQSMLWANAQKLQKGKLELASLAVQDEVWIGVRRAGAPEFEGPMMLVNESAAVNMLNQMWSYRDRNLVFALPIIVLMLMMLAVYLVSLVSG